MKKPVAKRTVTQTKKQEPANPFEKSWQIFMNGETGHSTKLSTINYLMERALKEKRAFFMESKFDENGVHYYITLVQNGMEK